MNGVSSHRLKNHVVDGPKKCDLLKEPDLDVACFFSTSVKFPVLFLAFERQFDWRLWLLRGISIAPQGLEDGKNSEKSAKMGGLRMVRGHISSAPPRA